MMEDTTNRVPEELLGEHSHAKDAHVESLKQADEALSTAQIALEEGRKRLQNAIARYEERMNVPR